MSAPSKYVYKKFSQSPAEADWNLAIVYIAGIEPVLLVPGISYELKGDETLVVYVPNQPAPVNGFGTPEDRYTVQHVVAFNDIKHVEFYQRNKPSTIIQP